MTIILHSDSRKTRVTLNDVAKLAGVSIATASIVLNGKKNIKISDTTREKIIQAANKLNYAPDLNAQILKGKTSSIIGLIIPDVMNPFYPEVIRGVIDTANNLGYNVMLFNTDNELGKEVFFLETLTAIKTAGIIITGVEKGINELQNIQNVQKQGIPVILVDRDIPDSGLSSITIDNFKGAYLATEHLVKTGHRRIALLANSFLLKIIRDRYEGFRQALQDNGVSLLPELIFEIGPFNQKKISGMVHDLLDINQRPDAIFAISGDLTAIEVIKTIKNYGLKIPDDISVVGFDDIWVAHLVEPPLTTVWQPKYEMGQAAMETLRSLIDDKKNKTQNVILKPKLIVRKTSR